MKKISTRASHKVEKVERQRLTVGLDRGDRWSWYCVLSEAGEVVREQKVATTAKAMKEGFGAMPRSRFSGQDGGFPFTPVTRDKAGNIYGTTFSGGSSFAGTVFKIDTAGNETVLHSFTDGSDGCEPSQGLVRDNAGNLYGTTFACASSDYGTIFKVDHAGNFTLVHSFTGYDGGLPEYGHLSMDKSGNRYGVTGVGGAYGYGVLYKLSRSGMLTLLHSFDKSASDGCYPSGSVVQDEVGNLYGTTYECGSNNYGTIWKLSKKGKETILHSFARGTSDGCYPYGAWRGT